MTKKIEKPKREVTKRQLSRWQREKRRQRVIRALGIFILIVVLGVVGGGWYISQYRPLHQIVIRVNDTNFDMNYYIKALKQYGQGQPDYYIYSLTEEVVKVIQRNELIRQEAGELGISVSDKQVDEELKSRDPPLNRDYRDVVRTEMIVKKLLDEYFEQQVPVSAEQRQILVMLLESESQATEVRDRLKSGEDFGDLAGELSLESLSQTENGDLGWHPKDVLADLLDTPVPGDYAFSANVSVLSQPIYDEEVVKNVGYWIVKVLEREKETEEAHVRAILLTSEAEALQVKRRLEAGEDFGALAEELSQHETSKEDGGDLGLISKGMASSAFDEFVFNTEIKLNTLSEPIRDEMAWTKGGYWLLKVIDKDDNREIEEDDRNFLKAKALDEWVSSLWDNPENEVDSYLDDEKKAWAIEKVIGG